MATASSEIVAEPEVEAEPEFPPHRMTVDRYERLVESGVYGAKDPVFLWHGRLVEKMTPGLPHVFIVSALNRWFTRQVPDGWYVLQEQPIVIGDASLPEPDLTIVRGALANYLQRRASSQDAALIVEVSDSSLALDSKPVLKTYATAGIPIYWIVNVSMRRIEVYTQPTGPSNEPAYKDCHHYGPDDEVPVILDGREVGKIAVKEILP